ncbi:hypothetical protein OROGR_029548 [Orobanche gracilis]
MKNSKVASVRAEKLVDEGDEFGDRFDISRFEDFDGCDR